MNMHIHEYACINMPEQASEVNVHDCVCSTPIIEKFLIFIILYTSISAVSCQYILVFLRHYSLNFLYKTQDEQRKIN